MHIFSCPFKCVVTLTLAAERFVIYVFLKALRKTSNHVLFLVHGIILFILYFFQNRDIYLLSCTIFRAGIYLLYCTIFRAGIYLLYCTIFRAGSGAYRFGDRMPMQPDKELNDLLDFSAVRKLIYIFIDENNYRSMARINSLLSWFPRVCYGT